MKRLCLFLILVGASVLSSKGSTIDSLETVLATAEGDLKVKTLNELFRAYINFDPVKAIGYSREALTLATEIDDRKGMAASYNNLGVAYRNQGALDKALEYYLSSLKLYDTLENVEGIATSKNNIGTIYSLKKDYGQAMKYFEEAFQLFNQINDQQRIIGTMNNLGNLHSDLQLYEQALKYYSQAFQVAEKAGKVFSDPLSNIGNVYFRQGNLQRAVEYYERALEMTKKENNQIGVLNITANLGEVYVQAGQTSIAQRYLEEALASSKTLQAYIFEPQILRSLAANNAKQGRMKEAYDIMLRYDASRERIYGEESSRKIAQMEIALDLSEKEKEMEALRKDDEIKSLELHNTRMVITLIILGLIMIVAFVNLFFFRKKPKKMKLDHG
jgi:tetratricopeptide (TPR) repeat protein